MIQIRLEVVFDMCGLCVPYSVSPVSATFPGAV